MERFEHIDEIRAWTARQKSQGKRIAFVPTMGSLHDGHGACMRTAADVPDSVLVASIFVNPAQFAPGEDLEKYPRSMVHDLEQCKLWGCGAVFTPSADEMYPEPQTAWVTVDGLDAPLCGRLRPWHFRGMATVVAKLFQIVLPDVAVFGQKDAQQALIIRRMAQQLNMPVHIRLCPIVREPDGLARSSRNSYLDVDERRRALVLEAGLVYASDRLRSGERDPVALVAEVTGRMSQPGVELEYVELLRVPDLSGLERITGRVILAVAAGVGGTRLIDNRVFDVTEGGVETVPVMF